MTHSTNGQKEAVTRKMWRLFFGMKNCYNYNNYNTIDCFLWQTMQHHHYCRKAATKAVQK